MAKAFAVLIDTVSIQKYVFASNKLKENIGASYLVEEIYEDYLDDSLSDVLKLSIKDVKEIKKLWIEHPEIIQLNQNNQYPFEIGYIGGGNALLFFREFKSSQEFIRNWTKKLLQKCPGLSTAVAISDEMNGFDLDNFIHEKNVLFKQLIINKNSYIPIVAPLKQGITADCPKSGYAAEKKYPSPDTVEYISSVSYAKLHAAEDSSKKLENDFIKVLREKASENKYKFSDGIEKVGQKTGESHIAIVHIDGNDMGRRFSECKSLKELRTLSNNLKAATHEAFADLVQHNMIQLMINVNLNKEGINCDETEQREDGTSATRLPLRSIVIGGDDITFITDGRLGLYLAYHFIKLWIRKTKELTKEDFSCCAGVAIIKTKYPFYRGYELAEDLCRQAKKMARNKTNSSWVDFHIAYGGFSGSIDQIRKKFFTTPDGNMLHAGPYQVSSKDNDSINSFENFLQGIKTFQNIEYWPRSKVKEFRDALSSGYYATEIWLNQNHIDKNTKRTLPNYNHHPEFQLKGWKDKITPYFDMVDLIDFYPDYLSYEVNINE